MSGRATRSSPPSAGGSIEAMAVHVDPLLPVHPLTGAEIDAMVRAGILGEDDRVELLDGVLVEMSPPGEDHSVAVSRLTMLAATAAARGDLALSVQNPLELGGTSRPQPDLAIVPVAPWGRHVSGALLVIEVSVSSLSIDLGPKAVAYAAAAVPEYWVLDLEGRRILTHRHPRDGRYEVVVSAGEHDTVAAAELPLTIEVAAVLPPR